MFLGEPVNFIVLRQDECLELCWKDGVCYIVSFPHPKAELAGEPLLAIKKLRGTEFANGQEKDIDAYQDLIARLPADMKVTYAQWAETQNVTVGGVITAYQKNRAKFAVDTVAGKFKFPDLRDLNFKALKHVDNAVDNSLLSQGAGGLSPQDLLPHGHNVATTGNQSGVTPGRSIQRSSTASGPGENDDTGVGATPYIRTSGGVKQMIESSNYLPLIRI